MQAGIEEDSSWSQLTVCNLTLTCYLPLFSLYELPRGILFIYLRGFYFLILLLFFFPPIWQQLNIKGYIVSSMSSCPWRSVLDDCIPRHLMKCHTDDSSQPVERGRGLRGEGDINPMSYIKRNTICVRERWNALKWMITDSLKITAA